MPLVSASSLYLLLGYLSWGVTQHWLVEDNNDETLARWLVLPAHRSQNTR